MAGIPKTSIYNAKHHDIGYKKMEKIADTLGVSLDEFRKGWGTLKWSLKALRVNTGLTAKEVADIVGIHQQTLLKYERDSIDIRVDLLAQLAELYHVSQDDIFLGKQSVLKRKFEQNQPN